MSAFTRRNSRAYSIASDDRHPTPRPSPTPPATRRSGVRGVRATSSADDTPPIEPPKATKLPPYYFFAPTVPSPFTGTLDASLDTILSWGTLHSSTVVVKETLLRPMSTSTNWPSLLMTAFGPSSGLDAQLRRILLQELVFLITRTLLPEQIAENRAAMARLYDKKKQLAIRLVLRYDMLREWQLGEGPVGKRDLSVASVAPNDPGAAENGGAVQAVDVPINGVQGDEGYKRRDLMSNIWPTLIAAPAGGFTTHGVRERMKHYVTHLDGYLLLTDAQVGNWGEQTLVIRASQMILQWQWLRQKNERLEEMEGNGWEELDGRADECEWIAEKKEGNWGKGKGDEEGV
ncbi:hypothetical protein N0V91_009553 [Didymella pomorum]|uniref:Uncharacterized protein n=1 Tax=Didymella pomorum TaxID=749634 RepID=A0A9W9D4A0_9PLEO|nr:hypothetical protein N0V91_009553 [Didymella pomorum]